MTSAFATTQSLGDVAARLLSEGTVNVVIGYGREKGAAFSVPLFLRKSEEAHRLLFDPSCFGNLVVYLTRSEVRRLGRPAVVVKGCDVRAANVLLREHVIQRDGVVLIGVRCRGVGDPPVTKCLTCDSHDPQGCDMVVGEAVEQQPASQRDRYAAAAAVEARPLEERWRFWEAQLQKCIRCYACRQACPLCYCKRCVVEKSVPQWIEPGAHLRGNLAWHVVRAMHLTGRCVGCGECERVCPMHLPLGAVNEKMARLAEEWFGFRSGLSPDEKAPFSTFSTDDREERIL